MHGGNQIEITREEVELFERPGPRYTSYPTANEWKTPLEPSLISNALRSLKATDDISLYVHIPFCVRLCHFCACTKIIDPNRALGDKYLENLYQEITLVSRQLINEPQVTQLHLGGGTPTYYPAEKLSELVKLIRNRFKIADTAELSVEANPTVTTREHLEALSQAGFNRISFGVQDFDERVQQIINRDQSFEQTYDLCKTSRSLGFQSLNVDLIYGLPLQTPQTIKMTVDQINLLRPDRIALYSFAKVPWKQPFQRRFRDEDLPSGHEKISLYLLARLRLEALGYRSIGMDHFALPHDELFTAQSQKKLHRNFMGYTTQPSAHMIGLGMSGISMFKHLYAQNHKILTQYEAQIRNKHIPIERGILLTNEDQMRRDIIMELMCNFYLHFQSIEDRYGISFSERFAPELERLQDIEKRQLIRIYSDHIDVLPRGQILIRNIAMIFDGHLGSQEKNLFSSTI